MSPIIKSVVLLVAGVLAVPLGMSAVTHTTSASVTSAASALTPVVPSNGLLSVGPESSFVLRSPEVGELGIVPRQYTGDGLGVTLPLEWEGAPFGTRSYAIIMDNVPGRGDPAQGHWVLYDLPGALRALPRDADGIGTLGANSLNKRNTYAPPCSPAPGPKVHVITLYALSCDQPLNIRAFGSVDRETLLDEIRPHVLAAAQLRLVYSRPAGPTRQADGSSFKWRDRGVVWAGSDDAAEAVREGP